MRILATSLLVALVVGTSAGDSRSATIDDAALAGAAALASDPGDPPALEPAPPGESLPDAREDRPYWRRNLFGRVLRDQKYIVTKWWPQEFSRPEFAGPVAAATLAGMMSRNGEADDGDMGLGSGIDGSSSGSRDQVASYFTKLGNGATFGLILGTTYLFARVSDHDRMAATASLSAEALLDAGIWIEVLKRAFARVRPNEVSGGQFFEYGADQNSSFPSGHAFGAFAVATVFAHQYRDKRWMPWVAYGTAGLIATSRVALGRHFPTDVVVGGFLGNSIGRMVVARAGEEGGDARVISHLAPLYDPARDGYGVAYARSW